MRNDTFCWQLITVAMAAFVAVLATLHFNWIAGAIAFPVSLAVFAWFFLTEEPSHG